MRCEYYERINGKRGTLHYGRIKALPDRISLFSDSSGEEISSIPWSQDLLREWKEKSASGWDLEICSDLFFIRVYRPVIETAFRLKSPGPGNCISFKPLERLSEFPEFLVQPEENKFPDFF